MSHTGLIRTAKYPLKLNKILHGIEFIQIMDTLTFRRTKTIMQLISKKAVMQLPINRLDQICRYTCIYILSLKGCIARHTYYVESPFYHMFGSILAHQLWLHIHYNKQPFKFPAKIIIYSTILIL